MNVLAKNLLILASAGSGKTYQLGNRVIGLVAGSVPPERIVALTFTRKAAGEFADSVLTKLAKAASDPETAERLRAETGVAGADFALALERVVRALPRFMLGTMDGFFGKVVRGFQYELGLTGGRFELLEGAQLAAARDGLLDSILGERLEHAGDDGFFHAFRRAIMGREEQKVADGLRGFVDQWQGIYRESGGIEWGPPDLAGVAPAAWESAKHGLVEKLRRGLDAVKTTDPRQSAALEKLADKLANHTVGSGSLGGKDSLLESVFAAVARGDDPDLAVKFQKDFVIGGETGRALREAVVLAARCELAAALARTRGVREVMAVYDALCEQRLRRRGLLGFDDIKCLMGEWAGGEDARLRREAVDFRLGARYAHWLLDEFQDTSRADWMGLRTLVDEAAGDDEGSLFVVGDDKQAIYAWRGGDVRLFGEVRERYAGYGLAIEHMAESWRSSPEVLALVNRTCGDVALMEALFGPAARRWDWVEHVSAAPLAVSAKRGEARVEVVDGKWEERMARTAELLADIGVGRRKLTCGVLVRGNQQVREVADALREAGFEVVEEGRREPARDHPAGVALAALLGWLADPANTMAREIVTMSPLAAALGNRLANEPDAVWRDLTKRVADSGLADTAGSMVASVWGGWSDFGRRRAGDLLASLRAMDAEGGVTLREAADRISRLEVSQSPGVAAVQVMTIHKSKGLGFDVVVVPDVPGDVIPQAQRFGLARGEGWLTQPPPKWARDVLPEMRTAEAAWSADQRYEAMCLFYVALTRAKRGLYVLLEPPAEKADPAKPSLANWLARAVGSEGAPGTVYQSGSPDWVETVGLLEKGPVRPDGPPALGKAVARKRRVRPSAMESHRGGAETAAKSAGGMRFGSEVHAVFERVGWLDDGMPDLPDDEAGRLVAGLLAEPEVREVLTRGEGDVALYREQPVDAMLDGRWMSGVIDRLHLWRGPDGRVERIEVLDFKTDAVEREEALLERHGAQMRAYRDALSLAWPGVEVRCRMISTKLRKVVVAC